MRRPLRVPEEQRLQALRQLEVLDSLPEACFDRITQLVADSFHAPIAMVSLVDQDREFFKSRVGLEISESPREGSFCNYTIQSDAPFVVPDATLHPELSRSPIVCGEPFLRFYAGVPLFAAPGLRIGALCVLDLKPRPVPDADQLCLLRNLALLVEDFLRMRLASRRLLDAQSTLRKTERRYRSLVENCPTGIYRTNVEGELLLVNPAVLRMLGFSSFAQLAASDLARNKLKPSPELFETGAAETKAMWRKPDGTEAWLEQSARLFCDENGLPVYYEGTIQNVTEQHFAAQKLREQEQRWELAVRGNKDGIWEWHPQRTSSWYSDRYNEILGYGPGELDSNWTSRIYPDDLERVTSVMAAHLRGDLDRYEVEYRIRCKDGSFKWILSRGQSSIDPDTGFPRMIGSLTDISLRKLDEQQSRATEERYRHLFEYNPLPVLVYDRESLSILAANQAAEQVYGYSRADLLGLPITQLASEQHRRVAIRKLHRLRRFPHLSAPFEQVTKDGNTILAQAIIHEIEFDGRAARIVIVNDITEITRAQKQLQAAVKQAEEASRSKSRFLATMSHEIRTPMNGVIGMTHLLLNTRLDPEQREHVDTIRSSGEVLLNIINDVLDFSKIESGRLEFERVEVSLPRVMQEAVGLVTPAANTKQLAIHLEIAPDVPTCVSGDPGRLCQVVINLLGNAVKFTEKGQVTLRLTLDGQTPEAARLRFNVCDSGIGIDPDRLPILFEPFTQADASTTRRFGGTGLGLAISKSLVELMGGEIGCESTLGQGSNFWFVLPMARLVPQSTPQTSGPRSPDPRPLHTSRNPLRVLVAEDNPINQTLVVHLLRRLGHTAEIVANGQQAVEAYRRCAFSLILMDTHMPEMDGFEATRQIRQLEDPCQKTVIISITANALEGDRERSLAAGMDDYLSKPINIALFELKMNYWADMLAQSEKSQILKAS
jgi:PAS domain S-box-containing protein